MTRRGSAIAIVLVLAAAPALNGCSAVAPSRRPGAVPPMFGNRPAPLAARNGSPGPARAPSTTTPVPTVAQAGGGGLFGRRPSRRTMALAAALAQRGQTSTTLARYFPGLGMPGEERPKPARAESPAVRSFEPFDRRALAMRTPSYTTLARSRPPLDPPLLPVALNIQVYPDDAPRDSSRLAARTRSAPTADEPTRPLSQPDDALGRNGLDPYDPAGLASLANRPEPAPIAPEIVEATGLPADSRDDRAAEPVPVPESRPEAVATAAPPPVVEAEPDAAPAGVPVADSRSIPLTADPDLSNDPTPAPRRARPIGSPSNLSVALFPPSYYDQDDQRLPKDDMVEPTQAPPRPRILKRIRDRVTARLASLPLGSAGRAHLSADKGAGSARRTLQERAQNPDPGSVGGEAGDLAERR